MATTYKTPGVYVEEIVKFPPSVAEVETAIPAFIGYTEKAKKTTDNDLVNLPTRIKNLLEYEQYFGTGPAYTQLTIKLDDNNIPIDVDTKVKNSSYLLYDSIRLFYDNGGGVCYIVSVGTYGKTTPDAISFGDDASGLKGGLNQLKKFDEPTLILFPDAINLEVDQLGSLHQAALKQCADLGDRFVIMDIKDSATGNTLDYDVESFRNNINMNNLKYGAAYHPYIKSVYSKKFKFRDINSNISIPAGTRTIKDLMKDTDVDENKVKIKDRLAALEKLITDNNNIKQSITSFLTAAGGNSIEAVFLNKMQAYDAATSKLATLQAVFNYLWELFLNIDGLLINNSDSRVKTLLITNSDFLNSAKQYVTQNLVSVFQKLIDLDDEVFNNTNDLFDDANTFNATATPANNLSKKFLSTPLKNKSVSASANRTDYVTVALTAPEKLNQTIVVIKQVYNTLNKAFIDIEQMGMGFEENSEQNIVNYIPFYKSILNTLNSKVTLLPPSGAIAGIYAAVDRDRGVWKAPANIGINMVSGVSEYIDDSIQEGLNVDPNAGKSINAIRPFSGKGIMVWGARTLAGNDNEWRYVPVRRFFNFVEESCKKSTAWVVFEPNDANTWARVKGQIDNFLNNLWRRGALAGAKPGDAYYIKVGLGITMTPQDILEGRLIVEIGMAAVRPAEFIILRFSHKLQQS